MPATDTRALERPLRFCRQAGCANKTRNGKGYCDAHLKDNATVDYDRARGQTAERKFYNTADWSKTTKLMKIYNPQCQRIENGKQCMHTPEVTHHLQDPKDAPHLRLAWSNLVAVCAPHHPGGQRGASDNEVYVYTIGPLQSVFKHSPDGGWPEWHRNFEPK